MYVCILQINIRCVCVECLHNHKCHGNGFTVLATGNITEAKAPGVQFSSVRVRMSCTVSFVVFYLFMHFPSSPGLPPPA